MIPGRSGHTGRGGEKAEHTGRMHACEFESVAIEHHAFASFVALQSGTSASQGIVRKHVGQDRQHINSPLVWRRRKEILLVK